MKLKKMTAVLGATALVVSCLGGCGSSKESASTSKTTAKSSDDVDMSEKVDISIGGLSLFDSATTTWPTEVIKAVEEKFNCTITVKPYDQESLNLDLSGGNTTDIVQIADANIEGALHVTLPAMMETFVVLFILNVGNFLNTGYEQYLLFKNSLTAPNIEVLDLYTYRIGLQNMDYSYGVAISVVKSLVSISLVVVANLVAKKIRGKAVI